ncbi:MAG: endolytic transglycosylase MltG [Bdellovibrionaceae bacterium]|nr:endolytic transglycosylase MltG [Pseudobdellovibrionaceae bacterium]
MKKVVLYGIVLIFVTVTGAAAWLWTSFVQSPASKRDLDVVYEVVPGRTFSAVAKDLEEREVIRNAALFSIFARIRGEANKMKAGEYLFRLNMTPAEVLSVLLSGKSVGRNFTVSEGLNIFEIADLVERAGLGAKGEFLKLARDPKFAESVLGVKAGSLEGYLFPETYQITKYSTVRDLIQAMVAKFHDAYRPLDAQAQSLGWTRHQVVTLASIIEKETGAPEERPLISSVFHNRLRKGMLLQTDPTVLYAKARKAGTMIEISITRADLRMEDDYNTYFRKGLPPGPIANPGAEALRAALNPQASEFLFFVSQNDGTHIFSKEYKDHQAAVNRFQLDAKNREGKSWRDLKKTREGKNLQAPSAPAGR